MNQYSSKFVAIQITLLIYGLSTSVAQTQVQKPVLGPAKTPQAVMPQRHLAVLENYCFDCHDSATKKNGVDLEKLSFEISKDIPTADRWKQILNAINSGEMPPAKKAQMTASEKTLFLKDLSEQMVVARKVLGDSGGVVTLRRLNRREYQNTLEALLGVRPNVNDLPDDQATAGFDTQGASLFFSSNQLEQYITTAKKTLELALLPHPKVDSKTVRVEPEKEYTPRYATAVEELKDRVARARAYWAQSKKPPSAFGFLDEYQAKSQKVAEWLPLLQNYLARPETKTGATLIMTIKQGGTTKVKLPNVGPNDNGRYKIRVRAAAYPEAEERFHYLEFSAGLGTNRTRLGWRKVTGTLKNPQIIEFPIEHAPGAKLQYWVHQRTHQDRGDKNLATRDMRKNGLGTPPGLWVDWAELEGPLTKKNAGDAGAEIFFDMPKGWDEARYAKEVIKRFATHAFRTKVPTKEYLDKLFGLYSTNRKKGEGLQKALVGPLSIVLSSPSFLYMVEASGGKSSPRLTPVELAVRLSYFLWSSPPDAELLALAKSGKLGNPFVLKQQTSRLLGDKRADRFVRGFVHQWLEMERLDMFQFKGLYFPTFDNAARESAREEIFQTVEAILKEKLPLKTLLKSDFVMVNDLLAGYYGLPSVEGHQFRKVMLPKDSKRGGLLGSAAVLAMGSDGLRSSPVERGA